MATPTFLFNHEQLEALVSIPNVDKILVSLASTASIETGKQETYLFAQAADANNVINQLARPVTACPDPPGWKQEEDLQFVSHERLKETQKFAITASALSAALQQNAYIPPAPNTRKQVSVNFDTEIINGSLVFFVPFIMKDATGDVVTTTVKAM